MLKNILAIIVLSLFAAAACVKTTVETNAANESTVEEKSFGENSEPIKSIEETGEKPSPENTKIFHGMINGTSFEMHLVRNGEKLSGNYFYTKVRKKLNLSGTIDEKNNFALKETDSSGKATGDWEGTWKEVKNQNGITLEGSWKKPEETKDGSLSFSASEQIIEFTGNVKFVDKIIEDNNKAKRSKDFSIYPQLTGINSPAEKEFNEIIKNRVDATIYNYKKFLGEMTDEDIKDLPESMSLEHYVNYDIIFANNDLVSLTLLNYIFEGGAHGSTGLLSINYDLKNNRELKLADIFEANSDYLKTISEYSTADLKTQLGDMRDDQWIEGGASAKPDNFETWNLTKKGLMITFGQYQVAPYAAGMQTVIIPYDKLKDIVRKDGAAASLLK